MKRHSILQIPCRCLNGVRVLTRDNLRIFHRQLQTTGRKTRPPRAAIALCAAASASWRPKYTPGRTGLGFLRILQTAMANMSPAIHAIKASLALCWRALSRFTIAECLVGWQTHTQTQTNTRARKQHAHAVQRENRFRELRAPFIRAPFLCECTWLAEDTTKDGKVNCILAHLARLARLSADLKIEVSAEPFVSFQRTVHEEASWEVLGTDIPRACLLVAALFLEVFLPLFLCFEVNGTGCRSTGLVSVCPILLA